MRAESGGGASARFLTPPTGLVLAASNGVSKPTARWLDLLRCIVDRRRDIRIAVLAGAALLLQPTCSSEDSCPPGQVLRYENPGCDGEAKAVCGPSSQDACLRPVCSCRGMTVSRCDYATEPFRSFGPCASDGGGTN
jgi:hypothetical protein